MKRFKEWGERERRIVATFFVGGVLAAGCSSSHVLGAFDGTGGAAGSQGGTAGTAGQGAPRFAGPFDAGFPGDVSPLGVTSSWTGYVENYQLPSGSDVLKLSFAFDPTGVVVGNVVFGTAAPLPAPTDPNVGYPPGNVMSPVDLAPTEGFAYTMASGSLDNSRLRFQIWLPELWSAWCALQTPVTGTDTCLPAWTGEDSTSGGPCSQIDPSTNNSVAVDCGKLMLCSLARICVCSSTGCVSALNTDSIQFDMALTATSADGSITGRIGDHNIRLTLNP